MTIKDVLVHVDTQTGVDARLALAVDLAERNKAFLTGLHVKADVVIPVVESYASLPENFIEDQYREIDERADAAKQKFEAAVRRAAISSEWRTSRGLAADVMRAQARYADLVIVGQNDPDSPDSTGDLPDGLLLGSGRPTVIVPYVGLPKTFAKNVMIAWDDSAPATRAVHDALPLMTAADKVTVVAVNAETTGDHGEIPCADICLHLARHGIKAEAVSLHAEDVDVADILLARAFDIGCDLIVMGGYGHSRLREFVLGGATDQMLKAMTVPVFMSH